MKRYILKAFMAPVLCCGLAGCGNGFLDTEYHSGIDLDGRLDNTFIPTR